VVGQGGVKKEGEPRDHDAKTKKGKTPGTFGGKIYWAVQMTLWGGIGEKKWNTSTGHSH